MRPGEMAITFLGTGTSTGVPLLACDCAVCLSTDPRDKRTRPALTVQGPEGTILVDAGPDFRTQCLAQKVRRVDACILTHTHADHLFGLDDLRQFNFQYDIRIPVYGTAETLERVRSVYDYCFKTTQEGGGKPQLDLVELIPFQPLMLCGIEVLPLWHWHGEVRVTSLLFNKTFAYVTDVSEVPGETRPSLQHLDTLVLGTVRYEPHPTHFHLEQAIEEAKALGARQTYFTHLSHYFSHKDVSEELPKSIALAYDGLRLAF
jgi:phosphoribosyl 1,2-cyclic phosphate phosphodiesterase